MDCPSDDGHTLVVRAYVDEVEVTSMGLVAFEPRSDVVSLGVTGLGPPAGRARRAADLLAECADVVAETLRVGSGDLLDVVAEALKGGER